MILLTASETTSIKKHMSRQQIYRKLVFEVQIIIIHSTCFKMEEDCLQLKPFNKIFSCYLIRIIDLIRTKNFPKI